MLAMRMPFQWKLLRSHLKKSEKPRYRISKKFPPQNHPRKNIPVKGGEEEKIFQAKQTFLIHSFPWNSDFFQAIFITTWWALITSSRLHCFYSISVLRKSSSWFIVNSLYAFSILTDSLFFNRLSDKGSVVVISENPKNLDLLNFIKCFYVECLLLISLV